MITTGFPSPARDFEEKSLDLNKLLISNPSSTFFLRAEAIYGEINALRDKDILVVDRSLDPSEGDLLVISENGELRIMAMDQDPNSFPLEQLEYCWGVVTWIIHSSRG